MKPLFVSFRAVVSSLAGVATILALLVGFAPGANAANPNALTAEVQQPYLHTAGVVYTSGYTWCPQAHWKPWGGDWAFDAWHDADMGYHPNSSCNQDVYLRITPGLIADGGVRPDSVRVQAGPIGYACASGVYSHGGWAQYFYVYATYQGVETQLGWVLYAHLTNPVYSQGTWINDPSQVKIGTAFTNSTIQNSSCWGGCHVHMEFYNNDNWSCYQNSCPPYSGIAASGDGAVIGKLGGNLVSTQTCPVVTDPGGGGGDCSCSGGSTFWQTPIPASDTYCGFRVCGGDNQIYECGEGNQWSAQGGTPCNCRCTNGSDYQGNPIPPDYTYCGYQVCGGDYQIYTCQANAQGQSNWVASGIACP